MSWPTLRCSGAAASLGPSSPGSNLGGGRRGHGGDGPHGCAADPTVRTPAPTRTRRPLKVGPPPPPTAMHGSPPPSPSPLSTEKYLPREGGGLLGEGRKGPPAGWKATSSVWAMYWMMSVWWGSRSSWSMLSLAARCRWNWRRLGDPAGVRGWGGDSHILAEGHSPPPPASPAPTSGVQAGCPLGALQLPLLDPEVGTGPVQAGVPAQAGEELQHRALRGGRGGFPRAGTAHHGPLPSAGRCGELKVWGGREWWLSPGSSHAQPRPPPRPHTHRRALPGVGGGGGAPSRRGVVGVSRQC